MLQIESLSTLAYLFFLASFLYSLVGFGGGSTYISILAISGISHTIAPTIALMCNIIVVTGGTFHFLKNRQISFSIALPFLLLSVPMAYIGGIITIERNIYQMILGVCLLLATIQMLFFKNSQYSLEKFYKSPPFIYALGVGGIIGFVSGLVGIGGGIFLAPILYISKWTTPKSIPSTTSLFILINSISGLGGQLQKTENLNLINDYTYLFLSVFIGGQLGSWLCSNRVNIRSLELLTSLLLIAISYKLLSNAVYNIIV